MKTKRKFQRSDNNQVIAGVLGGIANYFNWNATLLRVLFVVLCLTPGVGTFFFIGYFVLAFVMPGSVSVGNRFKDLRSKFSSAQPKNKGRKVIHGVEEHDIDDQK